MGLVKLPENELGLQTLDGLIGWTSSYFHFKQALEIWPDPSPGCGYIATFESFADRFAQDLTRQRVLNQLPKAMREKIAADKRIWLYFARS